MFKFLKKMFFGPGLNIKELLKGGGTIVDVRSPAEFAIGHVDASINIPLPELGGRIKEFETMPKPIITCCASGNRSGKAAKILEEQGMDVYNGGAWLTVKIQLE